MDRVCLRICGVVLLTAVAGSPCQIPDFRLSQWSRLDGGVLGSDVANARKRGFLEASAELSACRIRDSKLQSRASTECVSNMLLAHPRLNAVFAGNDEMALGASRALKESNVRNKIIVIVRFDATADGLAAVQSGEVAATVQQQPKEMGRIAIDLAMRLIGGEAVPPETMVPVHLVTQEGR